MPKPASPPSAPAAPSRRSDATKAAILAAAREQFAASGFQGATIRTIAAAAGIDPAMVMRYFGNKEQLFAAAAEIDLRMPDFSDVPRRALGSALVEHFLDRWEGDETLIAMLRSASTNEAIAAKFQSLFATQMAPVIAKLGDEPRATMQTRAALIATQMLGLAVGRYVLDT
jgi:AcrR family transcriptional regulator